MNRLESMLKRIEKRNAKEKSGSKKELMQKVKSLRQIARLFRACGDLSEIQAIKIEKNL